MIHFLKISKDTYTNNNLGICEWKVSLFGLVIIHIVHTTTQYDIVAKLQSTSVKQINGFK